MRRSLGVGWNTGTVFPSSELQLEIQGVGDRRAPPQARPRQTHAPCALPAPFHPGTRRSRHFAGRSLALAAAILRQHPVLGEPRPLETLSGRGLARKPAAPRRRQAGLYHPGPAPVPFPPRGVPPPPRLVRSAAGRPPPGLVEPVPPGASPLSLAGP